MIPSIMNYKNFAHDLILLSKEHRLIRVKYQYHVWTIYIKANGQMKLIEYPSKME